MLLQFLNDDRKGRKNGRGFYLYGEKGVKQKKQVNPAIYIAYWRARAESTVCAAGGRALCQR